MTLCLKKKFLRCLNFPPLRFQEFGLRTIPLDCLSRIKARSQDNTTFLKRPRLGSKSILTDS
jgi:hypothetical protein